MNEQEMKGKWNQIQGSVKSKWGKLTDDDLKEIDGNRDKLVGKVQERYGSERKEVERQIDDYMRAQKV